MEALESFLRQCLGETPKLQAYVSALVEACYDTVEMLEGVTEEELVGFGIARPHARKLVQKTTAYFSQLESPHTSNPSTHSSNQSDANRASEDAWSPAARLRSEIDQLRHSQQILGDSTAASALSAEIERLDEQLQREIALMEETQQRLSNQRRLREVLDIRDNEDARIGRGQYPVFRARWKGRGEWQEVAVKQLPLDVDIQVGEHPNPHCIPTSFEHV